LFHEITSIELPIGDRSSLSIQLPRSGHRVDDRCSNGPGYLLAFYPVGGEIPAGREASCAVELEIDRSTAP
jgi:hypothetical protein